MSQQNEFVCLIFTFSVSAKCVRFAGHAGRIGEINKYATPLAIDVPTLRKRAAAYKRNIALWRQYAAQYTHLLNKRMIFRRQ